MARLSIAPIALTLLSLGCETEISSPATGSILLQVVARSQAVSQSPQLTPAADHDAATALAADTLQAARAHVVGPVSRTLNLFDDGESFSGRFDGLEPGMYTVAVEGLIEGEVSYFGQTDGVAVQAGQASTAEVAFGSFRPILTDLDSVTTAFRLLVVFDSVPDADGYLVQWDNNSSFTSAAEVTSDTTDALIAVVDTGRYYIQVRASNSLVPRGRASEPDSIEVVTDINPTGDDQAAAAWLGFGVAATDTIVDVNIFPVGDEDWFAVDICNGDSLAVEVLAARLSPPSDLNSLLSIHDSTGTAIASNDDSVLTDSKIEIEVPAHGRYAIRVTAADNSYGHYQLAVVAVAGPQNTGDTCQ